MCGGRQREGHCEEAAGRILARPWGLEGRVKCERSEGGGIDKIRMWDREAWKEGGMEDSTQVSG